jgi:hypothetical protein
MVVIVMVVMVVIVMIPDLLDVGLDDRLRERRRRQSESERRAG